MKGRAVRFFGLLVCGLLFTNAPMLRAFADTTQTPPQGAGSLSVGIAQDTRHREFSDHGTEQGFGYYLDDLDLSIDAAPYAGPNLAVPLAFDGSITVHSLLLGFQYGITDDIVIGVSFPYYPRAESKSDLNAILYPAPAGTPGVSMPGLAQAVLTNTLGYDKVNDWRGPPGIGDVKVWSKYRFADTPHLKAAVGTWISLPTGTPDDERDLMDVAYGSGCYSPAAFGMFDIVPFEWLTLNLTGRYIWTLPYERGVFMMDNHKPWYEKRDFPTRHEHGLYDAGDRFDLETEIRIEPAESVELFAGYRYTQGYESRIDGHRMPRTEMIERVTWYGVTVGERPAGDEHSGARVSLLYEPVISGRNTHQNNRWAAELTVNF